MKEDKSVGAMLGVFIGFILLMFMLISVITLLVAVYQLVALAGVCLLGWSSTWSMIAGAGAVFTIMKVFTGKGEKTE